MSDKKKKTGISNDARNVSEHCWYYENAASIDVVTEARDRQGNYLATTIVRIPARLLRATIARMDETKRRRERAKAGGGT